MHFPPAGTCPGLLLRIYVSEKPGTTDVLELRRSPENEDFEFSGDGKLAFGEEQTLAVAFVFVKNVCV